VTKEFADMGESARSADRAQLQAMLVYVAANPTTYVIVHKIDRLARNRADDVEINLALKAAGVTLVSCTENIDDTPSGMLLHGIMSSIAEFYSRNLANEVIKGSVQKAKGGGTVGKAPTGYLNVRKMENGREIRTVDVDPVRGPLMKWAFDQYSTGKWNLRDLLAQATKRGLTSTPGPKTSANPLVLSHFHTLLKNPYYKGIVSYRGEQYPGRHEPLVSVKIWARVQELLAQKSNSGEKVRKHHHYLKGTVWCGTCGHRLIVSNSKNRFGTVYPYFICIGRQQRRTDCTQKAVRIDDVERLVEEHYATVTPGRDLIEQLRSLLEEELASQRHLADEERLIQKRRVGALKEERRKLLEAHYADAVPLELLKNEQTRIARALEAAKARLKAVDVEFDQADANLAEALDFAADWHAAYLEAAAIVRRQLNQAIFKKIYVDDAQQVRSELTEPFKTLLSDEITLAAKQRTESIDQEWREVAEDWSETAEGDPFGAGVQARPGVSFATGVGPAGLEPATKGL
jgi:site-specific DNA recombinase